MGTRSTVKFYDEFNNEQILTVYQQYDGYISGVGHELANWLKTKQVTNGYSGKQTMANGYANTMKCLAAQYVANFKTEIGGFYITHHDDEQDYNYHVRLINGKLNIQADDFIGTPEELLVWNEDSDE